MAAVVGMPGKEPSQGKRLWPMTNRTIIGLGPAGRAGKSQNSNSHAEIDRRGNPAFSMYVCARMCRWFRHRAEGKGNICGNLEQA